MTALLVLAILFALVVFHEFGHFIAAKLFKVRVEEFGVGYPPRAFSFGHIGETEYTLNWIPFGGFVRLFGDEGDKAHGTGSFRDAHRGAQAVILAAGVCMNLIAGWMLFTTALHLGVPRGVDEGARGAYLIVTSVTPASPAETARLSEGDHILSIVDDKGAALTSLTPGGMSDFVSARGGKELSITYVRAGATSTVTARPAHAIIPDEASRAALGVGLALVSDTPLPWSEAVFEAANSVQNSVTAVSGGLWKMVTDGFKGKSDIAQMVGPVGLVKVVGDASHNGVGNVIALAAFISVNLAVINLIPIPALDGGRLFLLAIEAVRRKDAPRYLVQILNLVGFAAIALLMILVTYHDIARLLA